jgi:hypothetical protein
MVPIDLRFAINGIGINSIPVMAPILAPTFGVTFLKERFSLKNGTFCPLFSHDTTSFKRTCLLIGLKVLPDGLYGPHSLLRARTCLIIALFS